MRINLRRLALIVPLAGLLVLAVPQIGRPPVAESAEPEPARLPNGKNQQDEILKTEHAQNVKDAEQLVALATQLKDDIEKGGRHVLSLETLKKTDEIEKLVKRIRTRMRRN